MNSEINIEKNIANIETDPEDNLENNNTENISDKESIIKKNVDYTEKDKKNIEEKVDLEENIEKSIKDIIENKDNKPYNFLINASNQANLTNTYNTSHMQVNALFVLVSPYYIEKFSLEGLDLAIKFNENGTVIVDNKEFSTIEIKPGIRVFGISNQK